jgi:hypothetical protein
VIDVEFGSEGSSKMVVGMLIRERLEFPDEVELE